MLMQSSVLLTASLALSCRGIPLLDDTQRVTEKIKGGIVGASAVRGHRLISGSFPPPTRTEDIGIAIIGGGVAGLSAAWQLERVGYRNVVLLELDGGCGGNATYGENEVSPYPWGAHYIPVPTRESVYVRELFAELGVLTYDADGTPRYQEEYLCHEPEERLFHLGSWQSGVIPAAFLHEDERREIQRFLDQVHELRSRRGSDGRPLFAIPLDLSSIDPEYRALDTISFAHYLTQNGYTAPALLWYLSYCCRDDFGAELADTSAWAGLHYFASRLGWSANTEPTDILTWPEGNGWIVKKLTTKLAQFIRTDALVYEIDPYKPELYYLDIGRQESVRLRAQQLIFAAPRFTAKRIIRTSTTATGRIVDDTEMLYRPWMVANITLREFPDGPGTSLAWDNVIFGSPSLGYVTATHQNRRLVTDRTVLTYYLPLSSEAPHDARVTASRTTWEGWRDQIIADLEKAHPNIRRRIERIDVWVWGHGMISPQPGYIWGEKRAKLNKPLGELWFAHSDMSGISIFEEAQYRGVIAANAALERVRGKV
jgi:phytoene dehydrogenase-like protein